MINLQTIIILFSTFLFGCTSGSEKPQIDIALTKTKAVQALAFCNTSNFNTDFCILIDMNLPSGVKRLIVWDFKNKKIKHSFLVAHGCCDNPWSNDSSKYNPKFSNFNNSHCSSLGKYKIGNRGYSNWGVHIKYLLHGLEQTNNNALMRTIVFHSWEKVPRSRGIASRAHSY